MNFKAIEIINKITGERRTLNSIDEFKTHFTNYPTILQSYINITQKDENAFLDDLKENWNTFAISKWSVISVKKNRTTKNVKKVANGEGSFFFDNTKQTHVYAYTINNKRRIITQGKKESLKAFKDRMYDIRASINNGTYIEKTSESIHSILERFIEQKYKDGITSDVTYIRNKDNLKALDLCLVDDAYKPIKDVTIDNIESAKENMRENYSDSVIDKLWGMLKTAFKVAQSRRWLMFNIMDDVALIKPKSKLTKTKVNALSVDEQRKLIEILNTKESDSKYKNIILFQLNTGMRIGEVLAVSKKDIDLENNTIHIHSTLTKNTENSYFIQQYTKTYDKYSNVDYGERTIPMLPVVREIVLKIFASKLSNSKRLLFWDYEKNTFVSYGAINSYLTRINTRYNISNETLHTHRCRHSLNTRLLEADVPLPVRKAILGHAENSNVTDSVYSSVSLDLMKSALDKIANI